ncbi:hypothetical protein ACTUSR_08200 [Pantoea stewartii subsp. indologenes]|uniref:hypothetical protein n=1 Tax=Pantoea stewartii TaxID=66269 RepID=UPI003FA4452A
MSGNIAKALNERQRKYDMLHHRSRIEFLSKPPCFYTDGTTIPDYFRIQLLNSSLNLVKANMSCNSVDLKDADLISWLDNFEKMEANHDN